MGVPKALKGVTPWLLCLCSVVPGASWVSLGADSGPYVLSSWLCWGVTVSWADGGSSGSVFPGYRGDSLL